MKYFRRTALASVINLTLLGMSDVYAADSDAWKNEFTNWKVVYLKWIN